MISPPRYEVPATLVDIKYKSKMPPVSHQSPLMAFADRLKPLCSQRPSSPSTPPTHSPSSEVSVHRRPTATTVTRRSPSQRRAREIVRKYRKHVRNAEFRRLRSVVPAVADDEKASQAEILEETIRYIDSLHQKLLARVHTDGLPARLTQHAQAAASGAPSESGTNTGRSTTAAATAAAAPSPSGPQPQMTAAELRALIDGQLRPQLEKTVRQKRFEDELRLQQIMMTAGVSGGSLS